MSGDIYLEGGECDTMGFTPDSYINFLDIFKGFNTLHAIVLVLYVCTLTTQ